MQPHRRHRSNGLFTYLALRQVFEPELILIAEKGPTTSTFAPLPRHRHAQNVRGLAPGGAWGTARGTSYAALEWNDILGRGSVSSVPHFTTRLRRTPSPTGPYAPPGESALTACSSLDGATSKLCSGLHRAVQPAPTASISEPPAAAHRRRHSGSSLRGRRRASPSNRRPGWPYPRIPPGHMTWADGFLGTHRSWRHGSK